MDLAAHTTTSTADALEAVNVAVLPVGSTEQHGPALPLGTDYMVASAFADAVGDRDDVVRLPTLPVGVSEHHRQFHGTLWTDPETFEAYVTDALESIASHGVRKSVVVNGHGGNVDALSRAARTLRAEETAFAPTWNWWESVDALESELFDSEGGHAGAAETSMMLRVAEELVEEDQLEAAGEGAPDGWGERIHGANVGFDTIDFTPTGAVGDPTEGSHDAGQQLFDRATDELDALIDWLGEQPFESLCPEEHL